MPYIRTTQKVTIEDAITRLSGVASSARYWVAFNLPQGISQGSLDGVSDNVLRAAPQQFETQLGDIGMMCSQMSFPSRSFLTTDHRHIGTPYRIPYTAQYTDVNFTFYLSSDLRERKYFEIWQQMIVNVGMNSLNYYDDYVMPVYLMQVDKEGNITYQINLIEAYPISIGEIQYGFAMKDKVATCSITMAYRHWINEDIL